MCADFHSSLFLAILKIWFYVNLPQKRYEKVNNRLNYLVQQVKFLCIGCGSAFYQVSVELVNFKKLLYLLLLILKRMIDFPILHIYINQG